MVCETLHPRIAYQGSKANEEKHKLILIIFDHENKIRFLNDSQVAGFLVICSIALNT